MKAGEILDRALALMFESRSTAADYVAAAPKLLDTLLPALLGVNNQLREIEGEEPLPRAPAVDTLEDEVDYEEALCRAALPLGLAAALLMGDEEGRYPDYQAMYVAAVNELTRLKPRKVVDVY